jgi:hypothetical protein
MEEENKPQNPQDQKDPVHKIPVIRTYEHDIEEMMAQKKISSASISIAEADARRKEAPTENKNSETNRTTDTANVVSATHIPLSPQPTFAQGNQKIIPPFKANSIIVPPQPKKIHHNSGNGIIKSIFKIVASLILIALGIWGGYYLYTISPFGKESSATVTENPTPTIIPSIVTPDRQKVVDISNDNTEQILSALSASQKSNTAGILGIVLEKTYVSTTTSTTIQITPPEFMSEIGMNPPDAFITSLNNEWMIGFDDTAPFIILTTSFFQNTFAGMLAWEPTMPEDLSSLFGFAIGVNGKYEDRILDNKNIREFVNSGGTPIFLYSFVDNQTLVIARNELTFSNIVNRIEKQTYVR